MKVPPEKTPFIRRNGNRPEIEDIIDRRNLIQGNERFYRTSTITSSLIPLEPLIKIKLFVIGCSRIKSLSSLEVLKDWMS